MKVKNLKRGDYFTKKQIEFPKENQVWIRGDYDRTEKKYEAYRFDDVNTWCYLKGDKEVYTEFTF